MCSASDRFSRPPFMYTISAALNAMFRRLCQAIFRTRRAGISSPNTSRMRRYTSRRRPPMPQ